MTEPSKPKFLVVGIVLWVVSLITIVLLVALIPEKKVTYNFDGLEDETRSSPQGKVTAYRCDPNTHESLDTEYIYIGETVSVCVEEEKDAIDKGIILEGIDSFSWKRDDDSVSITQTAIVEGHESSDGNTSYRCQPGSKICVFQTVFDRHFFFDQGEVIGTGFVALSELEDEKDSGGGRKHRKLSSSSFGIRGYTVPEGTTRPPLHPDYVEDAGNMAFTKSKMVVSLAAFASYLLADLWI